MSVFAWIRDGVRQSVLLGFSDAVEQLGVPQEGGSLHPQLMAALRPLPQSAAAASPSAAAASTPVLSVEPQLAPSSGGRKRLGRTLEQIESQRAQGAA